MAPVLREESRRPHGFLALSAGHTCHGLLGVLASFSQARSPMTVLGCVVKQL